MPDTEIVNVRNLVDDVAACVAFYTSNLGFTASPKAAFASATTS